MTKPSPRVSLVIPGLLGPQAQYPMLESDERPTLKNLTSLLTRATRSENTNNDWLSLTCKLLLPNISTGQIPFAAMSAGYDGMADIVDKPAWCMRIDPVHLRIDMDSAIMLAAEDLMLTDEEVNELTVSINQHLKQDGIKVHVVHPHRWYLFFDAPRDINTTPLHQVMGKDIHGFLPQGGEHLYWRSLLNELQMLLYTHPVNQQREQRGLATVNSVWFWGEGILPEKYQTNWDEIYTDNHRVEILAAFCGIPCYTLNQYQNKAAKDNVIIVMTELETLVQNQDIFAWIKVLTTLDASLFKKIRQEFKLKNLKWLSIFPGNQLQFELSQRQSAKWWKLSKPIADFLKT
jgi:hypothetical protein